MSSDVNALLINLRVFCKTGLKAFTSVATESQILQNKWVTITINIEMKEISYLWRLLKEIAVLFHSNSCKGY